MCILLIVGVVLSLPAKTTSTCKLHLFVFKFMYICVMCQYTFRVINLSVQCSVSTYYSINYVLTGFLTLLQVVYVNVILRNFDSEFF